MPDSYHESYLREIEADRIAEERRRIDAEFAAIRRDIATLNQRIGRIWKHVNQQAAEREAEA